MPAIRALLLVAALVGSMAWSRPSLASEIAHVDADAVIRAMPAFSEAKVEVEQYGKQLQKSLEAKQEVAAAFYQQIMADAQAGRLSPEAQAAAEAKLMQMQEDLQADAKKADQALVNKEAALTEPLYERFNAALRAVAAEKGYDYVLDKDVFLFAGGPDATADVKKQLGI